MRILLICLSSTFLSLPAKKWSGVSWSSPCVCSPSPQYKLTVSLLINQKCWNSPTKAPMEWNVLYICISHPLHRFSPCTSALVSHPCSAARACLNPQHQPQLWPKEKPGFSERSLADPSAISNNEELSAQLREALEPLLGNFLVGEKPEGAAVSSCNSCGQTQTHLGERFENFL